MKSRYFLAFFVMALALATTSCNKDDDTEDPIVGTWEFAESSDWFSMTVTMTFNADHTGTSKMITVIDGESESLTTNFTYKIKGIKLTLTANGESILFNFSISGNKLTLIDEDGDNIVYTKK